MNFDAAENDFNSGYLEAHVNNLVVQVFFYSNNVNKARRLIFLKRCSIHDLSKSAFFPLYGAMCEYGMPARGRYQSFQANSKISYMVDNWHLSPSLGREIVAAGPSFLDYDL